MPAGGKSTQDDDLYSQIMSAPESGSQNTPRDYHELSDFATSNGFTVTSTTKGKHNTGSAHYRGKAIDVRVNDKKPEEVEALMSQAKQKGYIVRDERIHPAGQKEWDGRHIHLQLPEDNASADDLYSQIMSAPIGDAPQKKSPDVSATGLPPYSTGGKSDYPPNIDPLTAFQKPTIAQQGYNDIFGKSNVTGEPNAQAPEEQPEITPQQQAHQAANVITNYIVQSAATAATPDYLRQLSATPATAPGHPIYEASNPHGDPTYTGGVVKNGVEVLKLQKSQELAKLANEGGQNTDPNYAQEAKEINDKYDKEIADLQNAGIITTSQQLAHKAYTSGNLTPEQSEEQISAAKKEYDKSIANATGAGDIAVAKQKYNKTKAEVQQASKYSPVHIGMEQQALLGNDKAKEDMAKYNAGQKIDEDRQVAYEAAGLNALQFGAKTADATANPDAAKELDENSNNIQDRLEQDHPKYFGDIYGKQVGSYLYNNENNPLFGTLFARSAPDAKTVRQVGKKIGLTSDQINLINPNNVPTMASVPGQFLQGAFNSAFMQDDKGAFNTLFTGNVPDEQRSATHPIDNLRGFLGEVAGGAGTVAGFMAQAGLVGDALKGSKVLGDVVANAKRYETAANLIPLAASNYNNAYAQSASVIGDKPKDEIKRHAYALTNAILGTAIMSIDPATAIGSDAIGATKAGQDLIGMIKKGGLENITKDEFKTQIQGILSQVAEKGQVAGGHALSQGGIMGLNKAAENVTDMIYDPSHRHGVMDNVGQSAVQGGISMLLPSLMAGINAPHNETPVTKSVVWEVGNNSQDYINKISDLRNEGQITSEEYNTALNGIQKAKNAAEQAPSKNPVTRQNLAPEQREDYAFNSMRKSELEQTLEDINKSPSPDKAQAKIVQQKIGEVDAQQADILNNAGNFKPAERPLPKKETKEDVDKDVYDHEEADTRKAYKKGEELDKDDAHNLAFVKDNARNYAEERVDLAKRKIEMELAKPKKEQDKSDIKYYQDKLDKFQPFVDRYNAIDKANQGEGAQGSVATDAEKGTDAGAKNNSEENKDNSKEDVSLNSTGITSIKTRENEKSNEQNVEVNATKQENDGRQNGANESSSNEGRPDTEVRSTASMEGRQEPEDRQLKEGEEPQKENEKIAGADTEPQPAISVPKKKWSELKGKKLSAGDIPVKTPVIKNEKHRKQILQDSLLDTGGDIDKSFSAAGYVNKNGIWVHPDAVNYFDKISPEAVAALKKHNVRFIDGSNKYEGNQGGAAHSIYSDGKTIRGIHVRTDAGDENWVGHDKIVLHETGHAVWEDLSAGTKDLFDNDNPISQYAKDVKAAKDAGKPISAAPHGEEDFAELFAKNKGDLQATIKEAQQNENNKNGAIPVKTTPELQTRDDGAAKGMSQEETDPILRDAMVNHPDKPIDFMLTDKPEGEVTNDYVGRINKTISEYTKPESEGGLKDNSLLVTHSNVIKLLLAAYDKKSKSFDFDKPDLLKKVTDQTTEPGNDYEFKIAQPDGTEKTMLVTRHGETEANEKGLQRADDDTLTEKGQQDAKDVAEKLKEQGVTPAEIISSDLPRAHETANIISKELSNSENADGITPPQPSKPLHEMTGSELSEYHDAVKTHNKDLDKKILGDKYKDYRAAQATSESMFASKEAQKKADKTIDDIEASLSKSQRDALYGIGAKNGDLIGDEGEVKPYRDRALDVESAQNEQELAASIAQSLIDLNDAPLNIDDMNTKQKVALTGFNAAKRVIEERGYNGKEVTELALKKALSKFDDANDAELMLSRYMDMAKNKQAENTKSERVEQKAISSPIKEKKKRVRKPTEFQTRKKEALKGEPQSFKEAVLRFIVGGDRVRHTDIQHDLGLKPNDMKTYLRKIAADGTKVDDFVEKYHNPDREDGGINLVHDTVDGRREFMDTFAQYGHDDRSALDELERIQGKGEEDWNEDNYTAHTEGDKISDASPYQVKNFIENGDLKAHEKATEDIQNADLTDSDRDHIISHFSNHLNYDGKVNGDKAYDPASKEFKSMYEALSAQGKQFMDDLLAEKETGGWIELNDKQKQDFHTLQNKANETATKESAAGSNPETIERPAGKSTDAGSDDQQNDEANATKEKSNQPSAEERSVATEAKSEDKTPAAKERQVESFTTEKGSVYKYNDQGKTVRFKTAEGKAKEPQDLTVFAKFKDDDQNQRFLNGVQNQKESGTKVYVVDEQGKKYDTNEQVKGKDVRLALVDTKTGKMLETVETKTQPEVGYHTFDQRRFKEGQESFRESHIGNKVSEIKYKDEAATEEKPNQAPNEERSVATEPKPEEKTPAQRIADIDLEIKKQAASLKIESDKRAHANKEGNVGDFNKHNANWYKKSDRITALREERDALAKKQEQQAGEEERQTIFSKLADYTEKTYAKNKANHKGEFLSSFGIPKMSDHVQDFLVARVVDALKGLHSIEMAIRRAIRETKEKYPDEAKELSYDHESEIRHALNLRPEPLKSEPALPYDHKEYAEGAMDAIRNGEATYDEVIDDLRNKEFENRDGSPLSDHVAENNRAKIQNYIDWHTNGLGDRNTEAKAEQPAEGDDTTSIKNDTTRLKREVAGLNEEIPAMKKTFGDAWEEAKEKILANPDAPMDLVHELSKKPRPITDVENAMLLHHQNDQEIKLSAVNDKINKAAEAGDPAAIAEHKGSKARLLDGLQRIYDVNKAVGTENARGLSARRMTVDRKYNLVHMLSEKRATANDGQPLSDAQQAEVERMHKEIRDTQEKLDNYVKESESKIIDLQRQVLSKPIKNKKKAADILRAFADKMSKPIKNSAFSGPVAIPDGVIAKGIREVATGLENGEDLSNSIKKAVVAAIKENPEIDATQIEREINNTIIKAGIIEPTRQSKTVRDMSGLFSGGKLNYEAARLKVAAERAKAEYELSIKKDQDAQMSKWAKTQDWLIKWHRNSLLSNPLTIAKLAMAGLTRVAITAPEELVGGVYSKLIPKLANGAIGEGGGLHVNEMADAIKAGLTKGIQDSKDILSNKTKGKSDIDILAGKAGELPPEASDFFGRIHSATKAPFKRFAFEKSLQKRLRRMTALGADTTDPLVQTAIVNQAMQDANRAIFMQDNVVAKAYQEGVRYLEGHGMKGGASTLKWLLPFVKVGSNIAAEGGTYTYGSAVGAFKLIHAALGKGIENLPPEEKDVIMRNLKKGSIGLAMMAYGYFNSQNVGGFYQPGQKRDDDDVEAGGLKVGGLKIPHWAAEAPVFMAMQVGATIRRVADSYSNGEQKGIGEGVKAGLLGLADQVPLIGGPQNVFKLFENSYQQQKFIREQVKSAVVPALVDYFAKVTDPADVGSIMGKILHPENKRESPKTVVDEVKSGVPYFREDLDEKYPKPKTDGAGSGGHF